MSYSESKDKNSNQSSEGEPRAGETSQDDSLVSKDELRAQIEELEGKLAATETKRREAEEKYQEAERERIVRQRLSEAGCNKPDIVFKAIADDLVVNEDDQSVKATLEGEEVELDDLIEEVRRHRLPEMFRKVEALPRTAAEPPKAFYELARRELGAL